MGLHDVLDFSLHTVWTKQEEFDCGQCGQSVLEDETYALLDTQEQFCDQTCMIEYVLREHKQYKTSVATFLTRQVARLSRILAGTSRINRGDKDALGSMINELQTAIAEAKE